MAVTYSDFIAKYGSDPAIADLDEPTFTVFLADALTEINLVQWGALADRATEMLIGHLVTMSKSGSETQVESRRIEGEGSVTYRRGSYSNSWFGTEYERLLKLIAGKVDAIAPPPLNSAGAHFGGNRTDPSPQQW